MMYDQTRAQQPAGQDPGPAHGRPSGPAPLVPPAERDEIVSRLRRAFTTFAHAPYTALEEAERAYDEAAAQLGSALGERRRLLRAEWQDRAPETPSDELRQALRRYRETTQRLLQL